MRVTEILLQCNLLQSRSLHGAEIRRSADSLVLTKLSWAKVVEDELDRAPEEGVQACCQKEDD